MDYPHINKYLDNYVQLTPDNNLELIMLANTNTILGGLRYDFGLESLKITYSPNICSIFPVETMCWLMPISCGE